MPLVQFTEAEDGIVFTFSSLWMFNSGQTLVDHNLWTINQISSVYQFACLENKMISHLYWIRLAFYLSNFTLLYSRLTFVTAIIAFLPSLLPFPSLLTSTLLSPLSSSSSSTQKLPRFMSLVALPSLLSLFTPQRYHLHRLNSSLSSRDLRLHLRVVRTCFTGSHLRLSERDSLAVVALLVSAP